MCTNQIKNLETLAASFLPKNTTLLDVKFRKLTSSGDNYGSILLAVDITVQNNQRQEHVYLVAKKLPKNELVQKMFNSQCTFPNEVGFYRIIAPCLRCFQKHQGFTNLLNFYPHFYTAAVHKDPIGTITNDSVLLIKNIKIEGFDILDRTIGFDFSQAKIVLEKMSELHATVLALKIKKPEIFEERLVPFFEEYDTFVMDDENNTKMIKSALDVVKNDEFCKKFLPKLEEIMLKSSIIFPKKNDKTVPPNHFFTLVHSDMWTNNIMVKFNNGKINDIKFVDYQLYEYASLTRDVVFFIYSSVKTDALIQNCDDLFLHYYESFVDCLKRLRCDVASFTFDSFLEDMRMMVREFEFFHIMTMLPPIYATSKHTKDVEQLEMDSFTFHGTEATEEHRKKACFVVKDFLRRGWLP